MKGYLIAIIFLIGLGMGVVGMIYGPVPGNEITPPVKKSASEKMNPGESTSIFERYRYVGHAFGGVDGVIYSNSLEAFTEGYQRGRRLFEVDLSMTSDDTVVAFHQGLEQRFGFVKPISEISSQEFLSVQAMGKFTPVDMDMLISLMRDYPDIHIITDMKDNIYEILAQLVRMTRKEDPSLTERIIPQIYVERNYRAFMKIYPFKEMIYTLARTGATDEEVLEFLKANENITGLTVSRNRFHEELAREAEQLGRYVFVHTLNSEKEMESLGNKGAYGFYTDFYYPETPAVSTVSAHNQLYVN